MLGIFLWKEPRCGSALSCAPLALTLTFSPRHCMKTDPTALPLASLQQSPGCRALCLVWCGMYVVMRRSSFPRILGELGSCTSPCVLALVSHTCMSLARLVVSTPPLGVRPESTLGPRPLSPDAWEALCTVANRTHTSEPVSSGPGSWAPVTRILSRGRGGQDQQGPHGLCSHLLPTTRWLWTSAAAGLLLPKSDRHCYCLAHRVPLPGRQSC